MISRPDAIVAFVTELSAVCHFVRCHQTARRAVDRLRTSPLRRPWPEIGQSTGGSQSNLSQLSSSEAANIVFREVCGFLPEITLVSI